MSVSNCRGLQIFGRNILSFHEVLRGAIKTRRIKNAIGDGDSCWCSGRCGRIKAECFKGKTDNVKTIDRKTLKSKQSWLWLGEIRRAKVQRLIHAKETSLILELLHT